MDRGRVTASRSNRYQSQIWILPIHTQLPRRLRPPDTERQSLGFSRRKRRLLAHRRRSCLRRRSSLLRLRPEGRRLRSLRSLCASWYSCAGLAVSGAGSGSATRFASAGARPTSAGPMAATTPRPTACDRNRLRDRSGRSPTVVDRNDLNSEDNINSSSSVSTQSQDRNGGMDRLERRRSTGLKAGVTPDSLSYPPTGQRRMTPSGLFVLRAGVSAAAAAPPARPPPAS